MKSNTQQLVALWVTDASDLTRSVNAEYLSQFGITTLFCASQAELMSKKMPAAPDVILADWDMDGMDGRALVKDLFASGRLPRTTPALLLTDRYVPQSQVHTLTREGFRWVLRKPIVLASFPKLIKITATSRWLSDRPMEFPARIIQHSDTASGAGYLAVC